MVFCDINHFLLCRFFGKLDCLVWLVYPGVTVRHNCYTSRHCRQIFSVWQEITHPFSNTLFQFRYNIHCSTQILNVCVMNLYVFIHYTKWQQLDQDTECFSTRPLCPWDSPGKNTGVVSHFLLQGIFLTQGLNPVSCIAGRCFNLGATRETPYTTKWQQLDQDTECFQHTRVMQSSARSLQYLMYPKRGDSFLFPKCDKPRLDSRKKLGGMRAGRIP